MANDAGPKHAVAYHFQNDFDTLPAIIRTVEQVYDGPVDYARDFMVWNVTKDGVRTRMTVPNPEYYPTPPLQEKADHGQATIATGPRRGSSTGSRTRWMPSRSRSSRTSTRRTERTTSSS